MTLLDEEEHHARLVANPENVGENLGALGWEISNTDMAEVDAILTRHGAVTVPPGWLED